MSDDYHSELLKSLEVHELELRNMARIVADLVCLLKDFAGGSYTEADMIRMSKEILANLEVGK